MSELTQKLETRRVPRRGPPASSSKHLRGRRRPPATSSPGRHTTSRTELPSLLPCRHRSYLAKELAVPLEGQGVTSECIHIPRPRQEVMGIRSPASCKLCGPSPCHPQLGDRGLVSSGVSIWLQGTENASRTDSALHMGEPHRVWKTNRKDSGREMHTNRQ